jgi:hypothetical protein
VSYLAVTSSEARFAQDGWEGKQSVR